MSVTWWVVGWIFMAPFVVYDGSRQVAKAPLGTGGDGKVRWVARALDPAAREVDHDGKKYWYFASAPTIEVRVFRDTKRPVELTSFEVVDATNVDSADTGQRVSGDPIELGRTHAFEIWPADESKPLSFRFEATYRSGRRRSSFGGTVSIDGVYPNGLEDPDSVESIPVAEALQAARQAASFSDARGQNPSVAKAKARRRQRLASARAARRQELAEQRRIRQQQRQAERQQDRAFAQELDQARGEMVADYRAERARQQAAERRHRQEMAEMRRSIEARKEAYRELQRKQALAQQQRAQQQRAQQQRTGQQPRGYQPTRPRTKRRRIRVAKVQPVAPNFETRTMMTPESPEKKDEVLTARVGKRAELRQAPQCGPCERAIWCPVTSAGLVCGMGGGGCARIEGCRVKTKKGKRGRGGETDSASNSSPPGAEGTHGTDGSAEGGSGSGSGSGESSPSSGSGDERDPKCPGPADERRQPEGSCLVVTAEWDECGDGESKSRKLRLRIHNRCDMRVYMGWTLKTTREHDGDGVDGLRAGETDSVYACNATGEYTLHAVFSPDPMHDFVCSDWH